MVASRSLVKFPLFSFIFILFGSFVFFIFSFHALYAQSDGIEVARTYIVVGDVLESGDLISFDRGNQQFIQAHFPSDKDLFGVLVAEPILVLTVDDGGVPIARSGEVNVNVTTANGVIAAGDYITSSNIAGKGQRAGDGDTYIMGIALESFPASGDTAQFENGSVAGGSIRVLLSIGTKEQAALTLQPEQLPTESGITEATLLNVIQYIVASFVALGAVYIAFKNFGSNIKDGIISIGRNPLAKSSIQSMVVLNSVLIILISIGGLFIGFAILLLPI